jgi:hypothetical protein
MRKKIFAFLIACAFTLNAAGLAFADVKSKNKERQSSQLAALLPVSDMVVTVNTQRLFNEALPQILSANQPMLSSIIGKIDEIKAQTGIDLRQFEQFAIGVSSKKTLAKDFDFQPVILARGSFNSAALVSLAKVASKGKYREEKVGDKTVYIFTPQEIVGKNKPQNNQPATQSSVFSKSIDKMLNSLTRELAVTTYDNGTLAIGSPARVRETFQAKTRVNAEVLSLVNRKPDALINFGARIPSGMSGLINLDNDELGKNLDSIRQVSGSLDVSGGNAVFSLLARTFKPEQAQALKETLDGLQMVGKAFIGSAKGADKKVFARMIDNARITNNGTDVMLDLQVPQSDIDILVGLK